MSSVREKIANRRARNATDASHIAEGNIEIDGMSASELKSLIKKWIQQEVEVTLAKNKDKLDAAITKAVEAKVSGYCKSVFSVDEGYMGVGTESEDEADMLNCPSPPKLERQ